MKFIYTNFGSARLAASADAGDEVITVAAGQGELFPDPAPGEQFAVVLRHPDGTPEIMHCWQRTGDDLAVLRGREGTTAREWLTSYGGVDTYVSCRTTAEALNNWATTDVGALGISEDHIFADGATRNAYFSANPGERVTGVFIAVGSGFQMWTGSAWRDMTAVLRGAKGDVGDGTAEVIVARDAALIDIEDERVSAIGTITPLVGQAGTARDQALAAANYVGEWSTLAGALNRPATVSHEGRFWALAADLVDVTASEPGPENDDWVEVGNVLPLAADLTVTVGAGGDFASINEALGHLSRFHPQHVSGGFSAVIHLLAGFTVAERVVVDGAQYGWITITGADSVTSVDKTVLYAHPVTSVFGAFPMFAAINGGVFPVVRQQFNFVPGRTNDDIGDVCGFYCDRGGSMTVWGYHGTKTAGVTNAQVSALSRGGGMIFLDTFDCGTSNRGIEAQRAGRIRAAFGTCRRSEGTDRTDNIGVFSGGIISLGSSVLGGANVDFNTVSASGIIFR